MAFCIEQDNFVFESACAAFLQNRIYVDSNINFGAETISILIPCSCQCRRDCFYRCQLQLSATELLPSAALPGDEHFLITRNSIKWLFYTRIKFLIVMLAFENIKRKLHRNSFPQKKEVKYMEKIHSIGYLPTPLLKIQVIYNKN